MKTKEELNCLKEEMKTVGKKLRELNEEELEQVIGGCGAGLDENGGSVYSIIEKLFDTINDIKEKAKEKR